MNKEEQQQRPPKTDSPAKAVVFRWVLSLITVLLLGLAIFLRNKRSIRMQESVSSLSTELSGKSSDQANKVPDSKPEDVPFKELTIPYLRNRQYQSSLGALQTYQEKADYTSYLTSYDSDGFEVNGLLTIPSTDSLASQQQQQWPALVFIHGYIPPNQYQTTDRYQDYVDYLAANGWVVFKIDLRGHGNSEGSASGAYFSGDYVIDALNAYHALQTAAFVDRDRIGLWGHSMGGNIVLRAMAAQPDIPAGVIWAGSVFSYEDFVKYRIQDGSYQPPTQDSERQQKRAELFETHGEFSTKSRFWQQVAPTNYLSDFSGAVQLHHAFNDRVVDIAYSQDLAARLEEAQVPHQFIEYQEGGHNLTGDTFTQAMKNTVEFYQQYL